MRFLHSRFRTRSLCATAVGIALFTASVLMWPAPRQAAAAEVKPYGLHLVPESSALVLHLKVGEILKHPLVTDAKSKLAKELAGPLKEAEAALGFPIDNLHTFTLSIPSFAQQGDQEQVFAVITTVKPYDKAALAKSLRIEPKTPRKDSLISLKDDVFIDPVSDTMFVVMGTKGIARYQKGFKAAPGNMTGAVEAAAGPSALVFGLNFDALPDEVRQVDQPEINPFKPLLNSKFAVLKAALKPEAIEAHLTFDAESKEKAVDAERSFKLLMSLAGGALDQVEKAKTKDDEVRALMPLIKEVSRMVKEVKYSTGDKAATMTASLSTKVPLVEMVTKMMGGMRKSAGNSQAQNNLKQIALAMHNYHDANNGFPPMAICDKRGKPLLSWRVAILPYIEQDALYKSFKLDEPWDSEHNLPLSKTVVKVFMAPDAKDTKPGMTHYRLFWNNGAVFEKVRTTKLQDITDGTSNTIMVIDAAQAVEWAKPDDIEYTDKLELKPLFRFVEGKCFVAMCDGSVRSLGEKVSETTLKNLVRKGDGNVIGNDF